jgi:hypothetical protein
MKLRQLFEASYDGMIAKMKMDFPEQEKFINDQVKWAKAIFKKDDKVVWWMKLVKNSFTDETIDLQKIGTNISHYFGYDIPALNDYQFGTKTAQQILTDLNQIYKKWESNQVPKIEPEADDYKLITFKDGSAWWFVNRAFCNKEGNSGKHCGNVTGKSKTDQRILSYRINDYVKLTFILEPNGHLGEMKAFNNQKPDPKYHNVIMSLLLNPIVKGIEGGGYLADNNFSIFDLNEKNLQVIQTQKPKLIADQIKISPREMLKAPLFIRKQYYNEISKTPGIKHLIDQTGEYKNDSNSWNQAIKENNELSLLLTDSAQISKHKDTILKALNQKPNLFIQLASREIRRNFDILKEFVTFIEYYDDGEEFVRHRLKYIQPSTPRYDELCKIAVSKSSNALQYVPEELRTPELCKIAVSKSIDTLQYVPEELRTPELCKIAVSNDARALQYVPDELKTPELCKFAVEQHGWALHYVPKEMITPALCKIAVSLNSYALSAVPTELKTPELCRIAVSKSIDALQYVPEELKTPELFKIAVSNDADALRYVPDELKTPELCEFAVSKSGDALQYVPDELKTPELCEFAVSVDGLGLQHVPDELKTPELCKFAVEQHGWALHYVPKEMITPALCKIAVSLNSYALSAVPTELKTPELCRIAVSNVGYTLRHVPEELKTPELCKIAVSNDARALQYVPTALRDQL